MSDALWIVAGVIGGIVLWQVIGSALFLLNERLYRERKP